MRRLISASGLAVCLLALAGIARASSVTGPLCVSGSFQDYVSLTGGCSTGPIQFFNFELYTLDPNNIPTAAGYGLLGQITIDTGWNPLTRTVSLLIGGFTPLTVTAAETAGYRVRWTADPPPIIHGESMEIDPPFGVVLARQFHCADGLLQATGNCSSLVGGPGGAPQQTVFTFINGVNTPAHLRFSPPLITLDSRTDVRLNPNLDTASGFDALLFTLHIVPEPGSMALTGGALAFGLAWMRRRRG